MRDFRELGVWRKAHALTLVTFQLSGRFPREMSGLAGQMQRAAVCVSTSIAEAASKSDRLEFGNTLRTALGWANQLEYEFLLSQDLGLIEPDHYENLQASIVEVKKMLNGLNKSAMLQRTTNG